MESEVIVYQPDEVTRIEPRMDGETVWLTQKQIAELFGTSRANITMHLKNALKEELSDLSTCKDFLQVAADGKTRTVKCYNLDAVLSVGYRVKSPRGVQFRQWASKVLKERIVRQAQQNALQSRVEALEQRMARLTGETLPCVPGPSCALPAPSGADVAAAKDSALVSLVTREMIRQKFRTTMDNSAIFIRSSTLDGWLEGFGITSDDVRGMVESGANRDFLPNYYAFPQSSKPITDPQGLMFVGRFANPDSFTEVPVIGGSGKGVIVERVRGRQIYGVICRLTYARM